MPGPSSASSSKPTSNNRVAVTSTQQSKPTSGVKRSRLASVSEDEQSSQVVKAQKAPVDKGKAKADPSLEGDDVEGGTDDNIEEVGSPGREAAVENSRAVKEGLGGVRVNGRGGDSIVSLQRQLRDLKAKLVETEKSRDMFRAQLQKLHQLRHTDPEKNMQDMVRIWEQRSKVQEEQMAELRRYAGLLSKDDDAPLKRVAELEGENTRLKAEVGRARQLLNEAERCRGREAELEQEVLQLKEELRLEIVQHQASRTANKTGTNVNVKSSNLTAAKIIKLYEDMTNVTITDYKTEKAKHGLTDNDIYSCIVSMDERSVGFKLNIHFDATPQTASPSKTSSFEPLVSYTPTTLAQETNTELLESLDFLCDPFDFSPSQFDTFLRTLVDRVKGI